MYSTVQASAWIKCNCRKNYTIGVHPFLVKEWRTKSLIAIFMNGKPTWYMYLLMPSRNHASLTWDGPKGARSLFYCPLKGQCHEMNNFLKALKINSVLSVHAPMVSKFFFIFNVSKCTFKVPAYFFENAYLFSIFYRKPHQNFPSPPPTPRRDWRQLKENWEQFSRCRQSIIHLLWKVIP